MYMNTWPGGAEGFNDSFPIGHIPEVAHTFAYYTATYGLMNEHQVGVGESTCACLYGAKPVNKGGKALLSIDTLSQIALERATSAREAVTIMGELAVAHGFYGEEFEGSGESLMINDPREVWVFHVSPDGRVDPKTSKPIGGDSAIWVAQRVPDDSIAVVDNMYSIREVNLTNSANFLGSASVHSVAVEQGLWAPSHGLLDFAGVYSHGEYGHKYYSGRRMWGSFRLLAPEVTLSPTYGNLKTDKPHPYPFAISP
jgi:dipeptidase